MLNGQFIILQSFAFTSLALSTQSHVSNKIETLKLLSLKNPNYHIDADLES